MENKQSQIKINLTEKLKQMLQKRAEKYGLTLAGFAKYLMVKDLEESDDLDFSDKTWKSIEEIKSGKTKLIRVKSTKDFFDKMRAKLDK